MRGVRAGTEPLGAAVLSPLRLVVGLVERAADLGHDGVVWVVTIVALALPLVVLPLLDRLLRKR